MTMRWIKKGLIFAPDGKHDWNKTHAQVPTVDCVDDKIWRIYYSSRDTNNVSRTSFFEVEAGNPENILYVHDEPILPLGELGTFDESGIMPSWIVNEGGAKYLFYIGWSLGKTIPYQNAVGLAISLNQGQTFEKCGEGPLFGTTLEEPYFTGTSCVLVENGIWRNWYLSTTKWVMVDDKPEPVYHIKYAESKDGIKWDRRQIVAIDFKSDTEGGIVKASVEKVGGTYRMWFSHRGVADYRTKKDRSYRIGYAESTDGIIWRRMDHLAGIDVANEGWDSEMICYPHVIEFHGQRYMFYNGNTFGMTGIGFAVLAE